TVDTLAFGYILPTTGRIPDLHRLETCAAGRTKGRKITVTNGIFLPFHSVQPFLRSVYTVFFKTAL
ncbi:MAG: hypothetical protein E6X19_30915, partial [Hungatella hathewayi]|nr:hypothetical protein [Hungatella hathewayi]